MPPPPQKSITPLAQGEVQPRFCLGAGCEGHVPIRQSKRRLTVLVRIHRRRVFPSPKRAVYVVLSPNEDRRRVTLGPGPSPRGRGF